MDSIETSTLVAWILLVLRVLSFAGAGLAWGAATVKAEHYRRSDNGGWGDWWYDHIMSKSPYASGLFAGVAFTIAALLVRLLST